MPQSHAHFVPEMGEVAAGTGKSMTCARSVTDWERCWWPRAQRNAPSATAAVGELAGMDTIMTYARSAKAPVGLTFTSLTLQINSACAN
jgi:hypothetical protein